MDGFIILDKIGEGSYSSVYKVKRKEDGIIYALKKVKFTKLKEKEKLNALNEIRILSSINNQNVISYKEAFFDEKDSTLNIIMEYADKGDLFELISQYKKKKEHFEENEIWDALIQLLNGLKSLHDLNILHRDLKSANVFLFSNGLVKLGDLNVSKITKKGLGYTQTGTPYYASPEVWKSNPYDSKSDIWSLGCVIYEMAKLIPPFQAQSMEELYKKIIRGFYPQIPSRYSNDLKDIIQLMIQTEVGARPSCDELLKMSIILEKIEVINKNLIEINNNNNNEKKLLSTIRIPSELSNFSKDLPKPKYYSPSQSGRDINKKKFDISNLYNCSDKGNDAKEQSLVEDKKGKKSLLNINKNSVILSPLKIKDNLNVNSDLILSNDRKKKINKVSSLISPAIVNSSSKKSMDKIILPEIKSNKNQRNYNSIEKSKLLQIKANNNNEKINSPYKVLKSESNVNSYNKNNYKYYLNIKIKNSNDNQRLINNIKSLKENKIFLNHNSNNNNILNRVLKHQYNILLNNRKYNWEEKK